MTKKQIISTYNRRVRFKKIIKYFAVSVIVFFALSMLVSVVSFSFHGDVATHAVQNNG